MNNGKVTLRDIYEIVDRLETKMDKRLCVVEEKVNGLESFRDNLKGQLALITAAISAFLTLTIDWIRSKVKGTV